MQGEIDFPSALSLLVGPNNAGKTNVIDALRMLTLPRGASHGLWIAPEDFAHGGTGTPQTTTFELEAVYCELNASDKARMVTCLSPSRGSDVASIRLVATMSASGRVSTTWLGGDSAQSGVEQFAREAVQHTYLPALRDAGSDLRPGRDNRLARLIASLAPRGHPSRSEVEAIATRANEELSGARLIDSAQSEIATRLSKMTGPVFAQRTALRFSEARFERVISAVRALAGSNVPLELWENGLGFNNLLYMATLLAAIQSAPEDEGNHLLLVEEPEAHLHPQLQDLLHRFLEQEAGGRAQVIVTTHSPNFASSSGVDRICVMSTGQGTQSATARTPASFGLPLSDRRHLQRFLDVTKAGLLFARGVILVEGVAEQLLLPPIARQMGVDLEHHGIAVVNVGGLSFAPFAALFGEGRLAGRCAILTDSDPPEQVGADPGDQESPGISSGAAAIADLASDSVGVFMAQKTLEWDLATPENWELLTEALQSIAPRKGRELAQRVSNAEGNRDALLAAVRRKKGQFAQSVADALENGRAIAVPEYIENGVRWATAGVP